MERKKILKKILSTSIRIFCSVIFVFQFFLLTQNYSEFNIRNDVTYHIGKEVELPEIHILIPYQFAFDYNFLQRKYKASFNAICQMFPDARHCGGYITNPYLFSKWFGPSLLLSDIAEHSYSADRFIRDFYWSNSGAFPLDSGKCKVVRQVSSSHLIISLRCQDSSGLPIKISRTRASVRNSNFLAGINLNVTAAGLKLVYPGKPLIEDISHYYYASNTHGKQLSTFVRFMKHTAHKLPSPYKTMCKNYDQREVFEDCLNNRSLAQTGLLHSETTIFLEKYNLSTKLRFDSPLNVSVENALIDIYDECRSFVAQPMCKSVQYSFTMTINSHDVPKGEEMIKLFFVATAEPDSLTTSKADFPLFDYLILSGSLFSTWFGISIMGQLISVSHLCCSIPDRKSTVEAGNQTDESEIQSTTDKIIKDNESISLITIS